MFLKRLKATIFGREAKPWNHTVSQAPYEYGCYYVSGENPLKHIKQTKSDAAGSTRVNKQGVDKNSEWTTNMMFSINKLTNRELTTRTANSEITTKTKHNLECDIQTRKRAPRRDGRLPPGLEQERRELAPRFLGRTCHILPPSEIDWGLHLAVVCRPGRQISISQNWLKG